MLRAKFIDRLTIRDALKENSQGNLRSCDKPTTPVNWAACPAAERTKPKSKHEESGPIVPIRDLGSSRRFQPLELEGESPDQN